MAKAEHLADKANPRFVVTSLPADTFSAPTVYERLYCARGNMENTIKEQQIDLFSDRTSATCIAANQLRLLRRPEILFAPDRSRPIPVARER